MAELTIAKDNLETWWKEYHDKESTLVSELTKYAERPEANYVTAMIVDGIRTRQHLLRKLGKYPDRTEWFTNLEKPTSCVMTRSYREDILPVLRQSNISLKDASNHESLLRGFALMYDSLRYRAIHFLKVELPPLPSKFAFHDSPLFVKLSETPKLSEMERLSIQTGYAV